MFRSWFNHTIQIYFIFPLSSLHLMSWLQMKIHNTITMRHLFIVSQWENYEAPLWFMIPETSDPKILQQGLSLVQKQFFLTQGFFFHRRFLKNRHM